MSGSPLTSTVDPSTSASPLPTEGYAAGRAGLLHTYARDLLLTLDRLPLPLLLNAATSPLRPPASPQNSDWCFFRPIHFHRSLLEKLKRVLANVHSTAQMGFGTGSFVNQGPQEHCVSPGLELLGHQK